MPESSKTMSQVTVIGRPQPKTWADYRAGALANYGGGHHTDGHLEAFQHGMETVFNLIEHEFPPAKQCKAAPELLATLEGIAETLDKMAPCPEEILDQLLAAAQSAIKQAKVERPMSGKGTRE